MRFILLALAVSCGGPSVEWAGKWRQPVGLPAGTYVECTLDGGKTSINWSERLSQRGQPVLRVLFSVRDCRPCSLRQACINSPSGKRRELRLRHHDEHHALQAARAERQA